ncbi:MAG: hypothetical protein ACTS2F_03280 [Thainema sp.]
MQETILFQENCDYLEFGSRVSRAFSPKQRFFKSIPPERIGLNGEYDHHGLAKRVKLELTEAFDAETINSLRITQRGRIVIFTGKVANPHVLARLVKFTLRVNGAEGIETHGVKLLSA